MRQFPASAFLRQLTAQISFVGRLKSTGGQNGSLKARFTSVPLPPEVEAGPPPLHIQDFMEVRTFSFAQAEPFS